MIKKSRSKPLNLLKLEAMLNRLVENHPRREEIQVEYAKFNAGYKGEASLDYYLADLPDGNYMIFHDLRLPRDNEKEYYFQIDSLIIHPQFCVLIEVKNLIGNLYFDHQFDQIIRTKDGIDETFPDPINQVEVQKEYFSKWLVKNKYPDVPLYTLVVITNSKSYIRISPKYGSKAQKIIRGKHLVKTINSYKKDKSTEILLKKDLRRLTSQLLKLHTPQNSNILNRFKILPEEIITGVACQKCHSIPMVRQYGKWFCPTCKKKSHTAHIQAIHDYAILFGTEVKNQCLREFLHLNSRKSLRNLLHSMNILPNGTTKAATYTLPLPK